MKLFILTAILYLLCGAQCHPVKRESDDGISIRILHTNDMHARFEETNKYSAPCTKKQSENGECYGGFARLATLVQQARNSSTPTFFLNAGDTYQGTAWYTLFKWRIVARFLNILHPDAISLGNHEFDDGINGLVPFLENANFPIVTTNLDLSLEPRLQKAPNLKNSTILTISDQKIAVIGYLTPETKVISSSENVIFRDEVEAIREEIARLKQEHNDLKIFVALGHSGYSVDKKIAKEVEDIDLVIGGHTNTFLFNGKEPDVEVSDGLYPTEVVQDSGRKVYVVQAYAYTKYLGNLSVDFDAEGEITRIVGSPILVDNSIPQSTDVLDELSIWKKNISSVLEVPIGSTKVHLDGDTKHCRFFECNLGNLITDSLVNYNLKEITLEKGWTDASICVHNAGTIRASITKENDNKITQGDVMTVLPFHNVLVAVELKGKTIIEMLEWSVHTIKEDMTNDPFGGFLQMSGLRVTYDLSSKPFARVDSRKVFVLCSSCEVPVYEVIQMEANYTVLMTDFLYNGGDGYSMIKGSRYRSLGVTTADVLVDYLKRYSPIYSAVESRIRYHNFEENHTFSNSQDRNSASFLHTNSLLILLISQIYIFIRQ